MMMKLVNGAFSTHIRCQPNVYGSLDEMNRDERKRRKSSKKAFEYLSQRRRAGTKLLSLKRSSLVFYAPFPSLCVRVCFLIHSKISLVEERGQNRERERESARWMRVPPTGERESFHDRDSVPLFSETKLRRKEKGKLAGTLQQGHHSIKQRPCYTSDQYYPQANGMIPRRNCSIRSLFCKRSDTRPTRW